MTPSHIALGVLALIAIAVVVELIRFRKARTQAACTHQYPLVKDEIGDMSCPKCGKDLT